MMRVNLMKWSWVPYEVHNKDFKKSGQGSDTPVKTFALHVTHMNFISDTPSPIKSRTRNDS